MSAMDGKITWEVLGSAHRVGFGALITMLCLWRYRDLYKDQR